MKNYTVIDSLRHDRKCYACGESVELSDVHAERLLAAGVIAVPECPVTESGKPQPAGGPVPPAGEGDTAAAKPDATSAPAAGDSDPGDEAESVTGTSHVESADGAASPTQAVVDAQASVGPASAKVAVLKPRKKK